MGHATITWCDDISLEELDDLSEWMELVQRKVVRSVQRKQEAQNTGPETEEKTDQKDQKNTPR